MREAYAASSQSTKSAPIQNGYGLSETDTRCSIHQRVTDWFKDLQPLKTWALIADALGLKEHAAKHRAACHRGYSVEEIMLLLHSENGDEIFEMLMADAEPAWWRALRINLNLSKAVAAQAQWTQQVMSLDAAPMDQPARRKLQKVINADRAFNRARAEKELAAGLLHQNQTRAVVGAMAPTMAKTKAIAGGRGGRSR